MQINSDFFKNSINEINLLIKDLNQYIPFVEDLANKISELKDTQNNIYILGNGGSFSDADHFCGELSGRFEKERIALPASSMCSIATMTSIANDYGFEYIFSKQLEQKLKSTDILIAFTTSGKSKNIIKAIEIGINKNCIIFAFTGKDGLRIKNPLINECKISSKRTCRIQEIHSILIHLICEKIDHLLQN